MKSSDVAEMLKEYSGGGDFAAYVDRCVDTYHTDVIAEIHKAITLEYFKYLKANGRDNGSKQ